MHKIQHQARWILLFTAVAVCGADVLAQSYPARPIRLVVPFAPGGGVDFVGRLVAAKLSEGLGVTVVVDNRGGGGGTIGANIVAKADPDGYTLVMGNNSTHGVSQVFTPNLPYDTIKDFRPISRIAIAQEALLTRPAVPAKSVNEFIALAKDKPGQYNFGSSGIGSHTHVVGELFKFVTHTNLVHIPYKGTGQGYTALMRGEVHLMFSSTGGAMPHMSAGRLKALGITGAKRSQYLPELMTFDEQGVKGFDTIGLNYLFLGPAKLPKPIVAQLYAEAAKMVNNADFKKHLTAQALDAIGSTPEVAADGIKKEIAKWTQLAKETGIRLH